MVALLAACAENWGLGLVILAGVHATWTIGITGGPSHGEHPFMVNAIHLLVAGFYATRGWPGSDRWPYLGLVGAGLVLGIFAMAWRQESDPKKVWTGRAVMVALYLGLLFILLSRR
jgi:hypothetical protein